MPVQLRTDAGPQFGSSAFWAFVQRGGIHHVSSSPNYPQPNRHAKALVKKAKNLITKVCAADSNDEKGFRSGINGDAKHSCGIHHPRAWPGPRPRLTLAGYLQWWELVPIMGTGSNNSFNLSCHSKEAWHGSRDAFQCRPESLFCLI